MLAEALNLQGRPGEALVPLNKVRLRAFGNASYNITTTDQTVLTDIIDRERRVELAFEGHRWFDLIRINNGQYALDFLHSIGKTNATSKHLLLPIPQREIEANPNLTQNPGY